MAQTNFRFVKFKVHKIKLSGLGRLGVVRCWMCTSCTREGFRLGFISALTRENNCWHKAGVLAALIQAHRRTNVGTTSVHHPIVK